MKTLCPQCETALRVSTEQLNAREGRVRCGICHTVFNAFEHSVSDQAVRRRDTYPVNEPYDTKDRIYQDEPYIEDSRHYDERVLQDEFDDDYYFDSASRRRGGSLFWVLAVFILLVALLLQGAVVFRNQLVHYFPSSRAVLTQLCSVAKCELGGTRSIEQFMLQNISLNVRSDVPPQSDQTALVLRATLVNKENIPAEWPSLVLGLKDERGQVDRQRIIMPEEYVVSEQAMRPMAALSEYSIRLHLTLEGAMATAYELKPYYEE